MNNRSSEEAPYPASVNADESRTVANARLRPGGEPNSVQRPSPVRKPVTWRDYVTATLIVVICSLMGLVSHQLHLTEANVVMILLSGVAFAAARCGRGPAIVGAIIGVLVFDFFFVPPVLSFAASDAQYFVTLFVMLGIGLVISTLTARLQDQLLASQQQEYRTAQLYRMTRELSTLSGTDRLVQTASQLVTEIFPGDVVLFFRSAEGSAQLRFGHDAFVLQDSASAKAVDWVLANGRAAGLGTDKPFGATALYVPMVGSQRTIGVLGVRPTDAACFLDHEQRQMLESCGSLIALSIERDQSFLEAQQAQMQVQTEQLRNSLLSAVSHDLRTPLATIAVTASSLLEDSTEQNWPTRLEMVQTVVDESRRLARQVDNLLSMAMLNSGTVVLHREWELLEELVGVAIKRLRQELKGRQVQVKISDDFPLLWVAGDLLELVLVNLLENAIRYTPAGSSIEIVGVRRGETASVCVADTGPGLPPGSESKVFDKFFRGRTVVVDGQRGIGVGLSICQGIVRAHGGQISASNRDSGGAEFVIALPCSQQSPQIALDEALTPAKS